MEQLDAFLMSLPASKTRTWVGLDGEQADRDGFGPQKQAWNASFNRISWLRAGIYKILVVSTLHPSLRGWF